MITAALATLTLPPPVAHAGPVTVFPGMEIRQDTNVCTLGFVEPSLRIAVTAGHCHGGGTAVADKDGNLIGTVAIFRDNTPNGSTVSTNDTIFDYEGIGLADDATPNNVLPGGRVLVSDPGVTVRPGAPVCHFGVATGESCGTVEAVNNGWFTMTHGLVSQRGDSGGPVYVIAGNKAVIVGLFNSTWGDFPAAVSWNSVRQQLSEDLHSTSAPLQPAARQLAESPDQPR